VEAKEVANALTRIYCIRYNSDKVNATGQLVQRVEDTEGSVNSSLAQFNAHSQALRKFYEGYAVSVDAGASKEEVFREAQSFVLAPLHLAMRAAQRDSRSAKLPF